MPKYKPGDFVIYRMPKQSTHPGPRAKDVHPSAHGDTYSYIVDKLWIVAEMREGGKLLLKTRRGGRNIWSMRMTDSCGMLDGGRG